MMNLQKVQKGKFAINKFNMLQLKNAQIGLFT